MKNTSLINKIENPVIPSLILSEKHQALINSQLNQGKDNQRGRNNANLISNTQNRNYFGAKTSHSLITGKDHSKETTCELNHPKRPLSYLLARCPNNLQTLIYLTNCNYCNQKSMNHILLQLVKEKYKTSMDSYNHKVITDIISNENTHIVSIFKDFLIYDDNNEFFKRFYDLKEAKIRIPKLAQFYNATSKLFPNYINISQNNFLFKNIELKQHQIDERNEENERKNKNENITNEKEDEKIFNTIFIRELNRAESIDDNDEKETNKYLNVNNNFEKEIDGNRNNKEIPHQERESINTIELLDLVTKNDTLILKKSVIIDKLPTDYNKKNKDIIDELNQFSKGVLTTKSQIKNSIKNSFDPKYNLNTPIKINSHQSNYSTKPFEEENLNNINTLTKKQSICSLNNEKLGIDPSKNIINVNFFSIIIYLIKIIC